LTITTLSSQSSDCKPDIFHDRAWWCLEAHRTHSDWSGILDLAEGVIRNLRMIHCSSGRA
jgi:hypothetical protein